MLDDAEFLAITNGQVNPGRDRAPAHIAQLATDTADMRQNLPILYAVVRALTAGQVLEIGTNDGTSMLAFLKAASETGGKVTSIDMSDVPVAKFLVGHYGLGAYWEFIQEDSHTALPKLIAQGKQYNVILVDGDHSYEGAKADIEMVDKMLTPGGILFTHDSFMVASDFDPNGPFGQRAKRGCGITALEMLRGSDWVGTTFPFNCGLAVWRRRKEAEAEIDRALEEKRTLGWLT